MSVPFARIQSFMSHPTSKVVEGVFAINKPPTLSSAEVIRRLQFDHFNTKSKLFTGYFDYERARRHEEQSRGHRNRRKDKNVRIKIGHGGTLDPMATGVLILGIGKGTKHLPHFLACTKSYEATIVFGAATDTYDAEGKILRRAPYQHLDRETVEKALSQFRGKIMQRPPLFSALRMDGKRLYEYAREGKELPKEIEKRGVKVDSLEVIEWLPMGSHSEKVPREEAEKEAKDIAEKVLHMDEKLPSAGSETAPPIAQVSEAAGTKRKHSIEEEEQTGVITKVRKTDGAPTEEDSALMSGALAPPEELAVGASIETGRDPPDTADMSPPAVRLQMTVTSGFYVRSLAHDLGEAVGSLAYMSSLVRTAQGDFELGKNVLEYEDLAKGEDAWGPKVETLLDTWNDSHDQAEKEDV